MFRIGILYPRRVTSPCVNRQGNWSNGQNQFVKADVKNTLDMRTADIEQALDIHVCCSTSSCDPVPRA